MRDALTPIGPTVAGRISVVCTSESDALNLYVAAGHVLNVATSEAPGRRAEREGGLFLAQADMLLLLADPSEAGERIADALADSIEARTLRLVLPDECGSVAELRDRGGVLAWLASEWARLGSPWPPGLLERQEAAMAARTDPETTRHDA